MTLTIQTTPAQDAALSQLLLLTNPQPPPKLQDFATSVISGRLDELIAISQDARVDGVVNALRQNAAVLTDQDFATLTSVTAKFPPA